MRLICPHCMSNVTVSDDAAGKEAACPSCGKSFPTPPRYTAAVSPEATPPPGLSESSRMASFPEPPGPPGYVPQSQTPASIPAPPSYRPSTPTGPPVGPSGFLTPPASEAASQPSGYRRSFSIIISPKVIEWLPVVFLTLTFFTTFFSWTGTHVGGASVYSQGPWWAVGGWVHRNKQLEEFAPPKTTGWMDKIPVGYDWLLMVPFLLLLILATAAAIAERVFQRLDPEKFPQIAQLWPKRHMIIAALSVAVLALLVLQSIRGFGLERAVRECVEKDEGVSRMRNEAQGNEWRLERVKYEEEKELARFNLSRTTWMHLAVACTTLAVLAAIGNILLENRGDRPPPKLKMYY